MQRKENYTAVIGFIENVFSKLNLNFRFTIIGNKPSEKFFKYESDKIIFTGFIEDTRSYFSRCLCMAVPLQLGAEIKIKILEGMCAGLTIFIGKIGIEGISARSGKDYLMQLISL